MDAHAPKELKEMHRLVCTLFIRPEGAAFRAPVDWKTMGLIDYPQIVKNPMDLGTIKANLESGKYKTKEEVAADIRLVWTNCMLYNHDGSEYYHLADRFSRGFEDAYKNISHNFGDAETDLNQRVPSVEDKIKLSYDVFKISSIELARVLTMVEESCPSALSKKVATDEVLLNFDAIPAQVFHDIHAFVVTCLANASSSKKGKKRKTDEK